MGYPKLADVSKVLLHYPFLTYHKFLKETFSQTFPQTIGSATSVSRKKSGSLSASSSSSGGCAADEVPIRLATAFAPSRAWLPGQTGGSGGGGMFGRLHGQHQRRPHDSLFVMANHGVLLEYTLDAVPDSSKNKL